MTDGELAHLFLGVALAAVANEILKSGLAEQVFREPLSIPGKFGGLIAITPPEPQRAQKDDIAAAAYLAGRARPAVYRIADT
jgi:hypothetical protein